MPRIPVSILSSFQECTRGTTIRRVLSFIYVPMARHLSDAGEIPVRMHPTASATRNFGTLSLNVFVPYESLLLFLFQIKILTLLALNFITLSKINVDWQTPEIFIDFTCLSLSNYRNC